jgi:glutamyl-tRNA synthetase
VLGEDGAKLSKRHGAVGVMDYEAAGYLPEAMINFLARIGWGHGDAEIFSRDELVSWFDLPGISPSPSRFNSEKLSWVNQEHMKRMTPAELGARLVPYLVRAGLDPAKGPDPAAVAVLLRDRADTLVAMADAANYFYATPTLAPDKAAELLTAPVRAAVTAVVAGMATVEWTREAIAALLKSVAAQQGIKAGEVMMPVRWLACGTGHTPAIDAVVALLPRDEVRARLEKGLATIV